MSEPTEHHPTPLATWIHLIFASPIPSPILMLLPSSVTATKMMAFNSARSRNLQQQQSLSAITTALIHIQYRYPFDHLGQARRTLPICTSQSSHPREREWASPWLLLIPTLFALIACFSLTTTLIQHPILARNHNCTQLPCLFPARVLGKLYPRLFCLSPVRSPCGSCRPQNCHNHTATAVRAVPQLS